MKLHDPSNRIPQLNTRVGSEVVAMRSYATQQSQVRANLWLLAPGDAVNVVGRAR